VEERIFVSLGANLGCLTENLERASRELARLPGTRVIGRSLARLTRPVGLAGQPDFLNQVQRLASDLAPGELMKQLLEIERRMGRVRRERWGPRVIDLDILFFGTLKCRSEKLVLPHPEVFNRPFFLEMIREIDPDFLLHWTPEGEYKGGEEGSSGGNP
jgi:2-amino-4-hydroxy-6-hydroxymethyldihydropteridine diphosphokinase